MTSPALDRNGNHAPFVDTTGAPASVQNGAGGAIPINVTPTVPAGGTFKQFTGTVTLSNAATTTTNLYTPTAGKTFYITDLYLSIIEVGTNQASRIATLQSATGPIPLFSGVVADKSTNNSPIEMAGMDTGPSATNAGGNVQILWPQLGASDTGTGVYYVAGMEI